MATEHSDVFGEITNKYMSKFMDISLIFTCFVIGFVMIAGAGSNLNETFNIKKSVGQIIYAGLIIIVGMLDFEKVSKIIGSFIIIFTLIRSIYTFYPIIAYAGIAMMILLVLAWYKERSAIKYESYKRLGIGHYMRKKIDDNKEFSKKDQRKLDKLIDRSNIDNDEIENLYEDLVKSELELKSKINSL